jgi:hypothetical protein
MTETFLVCIIGALLSFIHAIVLWLIASLFGELRNVRRDLDRKASQAELTHLTRAFALMARVADRRKHFDRRKRPPPPAPPPC